MNQVDNIIESSSDVIISNYLEGISLSSILEVYYPFYNIQDTTLKRMRDDVNQMIVKATKRVVDKKIVDVVICQGIELYSPNHEDAVVYLSFYLEKGSNPIGHLTFHYSIDTDEWSSSASDIKDNTASQSLNSSFIDSVTHYLNSNYLKMDFSKLGIILRKSINLKLK